MWSGMIAKHSIGAIPRHFPAKLRMIRENAVYSGVASRYRPSAGGSSEATTRENAGSPGSFFSVTM